MPDAQLLLTVPGVGVLTATALVAFVGEHPSLPLGARLRRLPGPHPREHSSGPVRRLGAITKHGNSYLRMLLIHGARSALRAGAVAAHPDDLRTWARALAARKGHNVAAVALANKLARVCGRCGAISAPSSGACHGKAPNPIPPRAGKEDPTSSELLERSRRWRPV
jgi:transposase